MADIKRDMAILATSGSDWAERTKRLATRIPGLDIFTQGFVQREAGGWRITEKGRAALELMEPRINHGPVTESITAPASTAPTPQERPATRLRLSDERARRRRHRREKRRQARDRARAG